MRIRIDDTVLYFDVEGAGLRAEGPCMVEQPTVILLHGGPGFDHSMFKPAYGALADVAQVIYLDMRGQGRSDPSDRGTWLLDRWVDDVAAFCKALEIRKPIVLGASFGGFVAYGLATRHPDLLGGMVILSSAPHIEVDPVVAKFAELSGPSVGEAARRFFDTPFADGAFEGFIMHCMPLYGLADADPDVLARVMMNPEMVSTFFLPGGEWRSFDYRAGAAAFASPSLIIHGEHDPIVPIAFASDAAAAMHPATTRFAILPGLRHDIMRDEGAKVLELIRAFIAEAAAE
ncbi:MAG: alpha/beta hydrolase [Novosphingobium sp.]|uniref:alpha/beta fold hydrolase n=1 Tax=Novosphingobium sp. TaxID=1874826 RepID=UPI00301B3657